MKERKKRVILSVEQIKAIRAELELGRKSQSQIADEFNVSQALISMIKNGKKKPKGNEEVDG